MKKIVNVTRTAYASRDFEIEIPEGKLVGMHPMDVAAAFENAALEQAGDIDFGSGNAEYEVNSIEDPEEAGL